MYDVDELHGRSSVGISDAVLAQATGALSELQPEAQASDLALHCPSLVPGSAVPHHSDIKNSTAILIRG